MSGHEIDVGMAVGEGVAGDEDGIDVGDPDKPVGVSDGVCVGTDVVGVLLGTPVGC